MAVVSGARCVSCRGGRGGQRGTKRATVAGKKKAAMADEAVVGEGSRLRSTVEVDLGDRSYPIYIGDGLLVGQSSSSSSSSSPSLLAKHVKGKQVLIVTNETVAPLYLEQCIASLESASDATSSSPFDVSTVILPDGEKYKSMEVLMQVFDKALGAQLGRSATIVALGGGVIGDMAGFAAAIYQRGCYFIQIPTTLLAMVDSSVGGKTGVNHPLGKNMLGAFYQPQCVIIDTMTLQTLPERELSSGVAEIIKYGLIRDAAFFRWQEENMERLMAREPEAMAYAIEQSCLNKAEVVAQDEREGGVRATLNLGHTFGHAIEAGMGYGVWLHGEAVAAGTVMAADLSRRLGWIDEEVEERAIALLRRAKLPVDPPRDPAKLSPARYKELMAVDKKSVNGKMRFILLKGKLGECVFTGDFDASKLDETLEEFTAT